MIATTIYKIQTTTPPSAGNNKHKLGTTATKFKQTTIQAQAQYQQPVQDQIPPWDM